MSTSSSPTESTNNETSYIDFADEVENPSVGWWVQLVGTFVLTLFGIPGNILSILVMKSSRYRHKSYSHYLTALAVFDSLVLVNKCFIRIDALRVHLDPDFRSVRTASESADPTCKLHDFGQHVCYLMSSWLVVSMSVERLIAVIFPFRKDRLCHPRNGITVILLIFAVVSYSQIFRLVIFTSQSGICTASDQFRHVYVILHIYLYQLVLQFLLPNLLILLSNVVVLCSIRKQNRKFARTGSVHRQHPRGDRTRRGKATCMLLAVSFTYIVTLLPLLLASLVVHICIVTNEPLAMAIFSKLWHLRFYLELFSEINYAANFFIYILSGEQFRLALRRLCRHPANGTRDTSVLACHPGADRASRSDQGDCKHETITTEIHRITTDTDL